METVLGWLRAAWLGIASLFGVHEDAATRPVFYGYVEADYQRLAPTQGGVLTELRTARGDPGRAGDALVFLDATAEQAAVAQARARVAQMEAQLADLRNHEDAATRPVFYGYVEA